MGHPGRPSPRKEKQIQQAILSAVPIEPPGISFGNVAGNAKRLLGISRPTVWRHLEKFTHMRIVVHEGRFYRRNPLMADLPVGMDRIKMDSLHRLQSTDFWTPQRYWRADPIETPDELYAFFRKTIANVVWGYLELLHAITTMPNLPAARELANLMIDSHVNWFLMLMAREVWEKRATVRLNSLAGKEVKVVSYTKHGRR
jgi:hypothetical protein